MVFTFLLIVQALVAASLVAVILMQRSEGGGLGVGGSSSGFMTARGAADFLTRTTAVLGAIFVGLSILLAAFAGARGKATTVDTSLANQAAPAPAQTAPLESAPAPAQPQPATSGKPQQNQQTQQNRQAPAVPLAQ